jgi:murein DD-endopeptidase MepM/ murein hydrolase activator NlpD
MSISVCGIQFMRMVRTSPKLAGIALVATLGLGGCSADISRFESTNSFGLTDSKPAAEVSRRNNQSMPLQNADQNGAYFPPSSGRGTTNAGVSSEPLPGPGGFGGAASPSVPFDRPRAARPGVAAAHSAKPIPSSGSIDVVQGDTLYGLARKHGVAVNELMTVNAMTTPNLKPGQKLLLPANKSLARAVPARPVAAAVAAAPVPPVTAPVAAAAVRPVKKPAVAVAEAAPAAAAPVATPVSAVKAPVMLNGTKVASVHPANTVTDAPAPESAVAATVEPRSKGTEVASAAGAAGAAGPGAKFRWPVKGKVIASFGPRTDGTHNDGVNVAVPQGTEVHAAEQGVVAYAGSELKGYGNLVLLRHESGWVTAYAHNEEVLVKRGDKIKRGQAIAKAGKTGTVDQPQVHFELRQGQKPVDPTPHMEKM